MIGQILWFYLLKHYAKICFLVFSIFFILAYILNSTTHISLLLRIKDLGAGIGFAYSLLQMPLIITKLIPFIVFFSALFHFLVLNKSSELVILRSCGLSVWQFISPACIIALLISLFSIFALNPLTVWSIKKSEYFLNYSTKASKRVLNQNDYTWFSQTDRERNITIGAKIIDENEIKLKDAIFIIFDKKHSKKPIWYVVEQASLKKNYWFLPHVESYQINEKPETLFNIKIPTKIKPNFIKNYLITSKVTPFYDLLYKIKAVQSFGISSNKLKTEFYTLIATPILLLSLVFTAASVSLGFSRYGQTSILIFSGLFAGFLTYSLTIISQSFGESGYVPPELAAFTPALSAFFISISFLLHQEEA